MRERSLSSACGAQEEAETILDYATQREWREFQAFLPEDLRFAGHYSPIEAWWSWKGFDVHLDVFRKPDAKAKLVLFHGLANNGRHMSLILGGPLWQLGFETISIDMPGYGMTKVPPSRDVTYDDWVCLAHEFIEDELTADPRPVLLFGLSAGGMLTYHVAALNRNVRGIIGTTFLDQHEKQVRDETALNLFISRVGAPFVKLVAKTSFARVKMPMRFVSKVSALVNNESALKVLLMDKTSAGNSVTVKFLSTYLSYEPLVEPGCFSVCPIWLTHPGQDRWTALHLSEIFLRRVINAPVKVVILENAGHFPIEQPGLNQMRAAVAEFVAQLCA